MNNHLQTGIDFSQQRADFHLQTPDGLPIESHVSFLNSCSGFAAAKQLLLDTLDSYDLDGIDISAEATGFFWLPFFLQLAADPGITRVALEIAERP